MSGGEASRALQKETRMFLNVDASGRISWVSHVLRANEAVELFCGEVAELQSGFAEAKIFMMRFVSDFGGFVVSNLRTESGDEH